jgi:hypothetical protein
MRRSDGLSREALASYDKIRRAPGRARRTSLYTVRLSLIYLRVHSLNILNIGKLLAAWTQTPTKWYPLPLAVGALLLVALQYRHKLARSEKEVHVDERGHEVIKLKGPWQVRAILS